MEARHGREVGLDEVRHQDEHHPADQRGEEDCPGNGLARVAGFFRQAGHCIEAQEREAQDGCASRQGAEMGLAVGEGQQAPGGAQPFAVVQAPYAEVDEHGNDRDLHRHEQQVEVCHQVDAAHVDQADQADEPSHPHPRRHFGEHGRQVELGQQRVDHGQEQVVQQR
ncbi:hypothetical protein D3C81_1239410 [compost metagenome]